MIEVLVTLLVFTVGLLGFAGLQLNALQSTGDGAQRSQAVWITQELAERMRANPEATDTDYTTAVINCAALPPQRCGDYFDPITGAKVNSAICTAVQMAAYDRWEAQCSYSATNNYRADATAANGRYSSRDFLSQPPAGTAPLTMNLNGTRVQVTANWFSRGNDRKADQSLSSTLEIQR